MFKHIACGGVVAAVALSGLGAGGAGASAIAGRAGPAAGHAVVTAGTAGAVPGAQLWGQRYNGPGNSYDLAYSVAVSPDGGRVFVTGQSVGASSVPEYATVAYSTATGARLWVSRYAGPPGSDGIAASVAASPVGGRVFVTGGSGTVAYNAATGARLWATQTTGLFVGDTADPLAVSPDGSTVFVTGSVTPPGRHDDYLTVAYSASTGAQLWASRYAGPGNSYDIPAAVAVSPGGGSVFVTGHSGIGGYTTIAYRAATGARLWIKGYNGRPGDGAIATALAVSPTGKTLFVTGQDILAANGKRNYMTVAYSASSGARLWVKRYNFGDDYAIAMAVSPDGSRVFVTGNSAGATPGTGALATVAYRASTGAQLWVNRYTNGNNAAALAVSPGGDKVYLTGESSATAEGYDYATVAFSTATGAQLWAKRYNGPANGDDEAFAVAVSPTSGVVFVTGASHGINSDWDYATIAYSG